MSIRLIISKNSTHLHSRVRDFIRDYEQDIHHVRFPSKVYLLSGDEVWFITEQMLPDCVRGIEIASWEGDANYFVPEKFHEMLNYRIRGK